MASKMMSGHSNLGFKNKTQSMIDNDLNTIDLFFIKLIISKRISFTH